MENINQEQIDFLSLHTISKTLHGELDYIQGFIDVRKIDPSPYQHRRHFDEDKLKELAASIQREGLIEPIIVRPIDKRYQLIAGERRLRAVRNFTEMETIQAQIVIALNYLHNPAGRHNRNTLDKKVYMVFI